MWLKETKNYHQFYMLKNNAKKLEDIKEKYFQNDI